MEDFGRIPRQKKKMSDTKLKKRSNILISFFTLSGSVAVFWIFITSLPTGFVVATFTYSKGYSYLFDDPKACVNCHIMQDHFYAYEKSSHHHVATCNDCHTPSGFIPKYFSKAINGWNHGQAFTTGKFPWPLQITSFNRKIVANSCYKCHEGIINHTFNEQTNCVHCHANVGHIR